MTTLRICFLLIIIHIGFQLNGQIETEIKIDGLVIPRIDRTTVNNPSLGQLIFDLNTSKFWFFDGQNWLEVDNDNQTLSQILNMDNDAGNHRIKNALDPIDAKDLATKHYVDSISSGAWIINADTIHSNKNVGIGVTNPSQKLEINGAISISNNDAEPDAGTIRWNELTQDFEGFTGSEWKSLTRENQWSCNKTANDCQQLLNSDSGANHFFGFSLSIDGDHAVIGAYGTSSAGPNTGSAYIFKRDGSNWIEQDVLKASDAASGDHFGISTAIDGDYVVIGAFRNDDNGNDSGSAYIFKNNGSNWVEETILKASDASSDDHFGRSVSISDEYVLIGALRNDDNGNDSGSAYIFKNNGSNWVEELKLTASDASADDRFGFSVSISGEHAIIGAYLNDEKGTNSGAAYIYRNDNNTWVEEIKLLASDATIEDRFGRNVSIYNEYVIVGSHLNDEGGEDAGAAYIFKKKNNVWIEETKLLASDATSHDWFGISVSISNSHAVAGSFQNDIGGTDTGSAYVFKRVGETWYEEALLLASDGTDEDEFGFSTGISGNTIFIGAIRKDDGNSNTGGVYIFK